MEINEQSGFIQSTISFPLEKSLYDKKTINESLKEFQHLCTGEVKETNDKIIITLYIKSDIDAEILKYEFCNYVLGQMKNKSLV